MPIEEIVEGLIEEEHFGGLKYDIDLIYYNPEKPTLVVLDKEGEVVSGIGGDAMIDYSFPEGTAHLNEPKKVDEVAERVIDYFHETAIAYLEGGPSEHVLIPDTNRGRRLLQEYAKKFTDYVPYSLPHEYADSGQIQLERRIIRALRVVRQSHIQRCRKQKFDPDHPEQLEFFPVNGNYKINEGQKMARGRAAEYLQSEEVVDYLTNIKNRHHYF